MLDFVCARDASGSAGVPQRQECVQVRSVDRWRGGATTTLELLHAGGARGHEAVQLSAAPSPCLTLREKVAAMQQVNLFLVRLADGGEGRLALDKGAGGALER